MQKLFKSIGIGSEPFKPVAYYDEILDAIRVITVNCSMTEVRVSPELNLFERNHIADGQARYVGFSIAPAVIFCGDAGLPTKGAVKISEVLKTLGNHTKISRARGAIKEVALPLLEDNGLDEVHFPSV